MSATRDLLLMNLYEVFNNRDGLDRRRRIDATYTEDVTFIDPDGTYRGRDALDRRAAELLDRSPHDFSFAEDGPAYVDENAGALAWTFGPAESPVARGIDIITIREGRISAVLSLLIDPSREA